MSTSDIRPLPVPDAVAYADRAGVPNRRAAAAHLLGVRQLRDTLAITSPPSLTIAVVVGVQAALSLLLATSASWAAGHAKLAYFSALGSLASLYGRHVALSERRRIIAVCGALLVVAVTVPATASFLQASVPVRCALIAVAASASTLAVAQASGWRYPGWAAVGALAVMQGTHLHITASRALQRTIGTVIGVAATWIILSNTTSHSTLIVISALFLLLTEIIVGFNYGLGVGSCDTSRLADGLHRRTAAADVAHG